MRMTDAQARRPREAKPHKAKPSKAQPEKAKPRKAKPRRLGRPPGQSGDDTRRAILIAARDSFAVRGFEGATNAEIAAAANVTSAAMYRHFESKAELYAAVVHDALADVIPRVKQAVAKQPSVRAAFASLLAVWSSIDARQQSSVRFLSAVPSEMQRHPQISERMFADPGAVFTIVNELVESGVSSGEISRAKAQRVVSVMIATFMGVSAYSNTLGPSFAEQAITGLVELIQGELFERAR
jgi:AcrR family transcriptional regulator